MTHEGPPAPLSDISQTPLPSKEAVRDAIKRAITEQEIGEALRRESYERPFGFGMRGFDIDSPEVEANIFITNPDVTTENSK